MALQFEDVEIRKGGHPIDFVDIPKGSDGSRPAVVLDFIIEDQGSAGLAALNTSTPHVFLRASYWLGRHKLHGIAGNPDARDARNPDINALTLGYTHWFSPSLCFRNGSQLQDRDSD